MAAHTILFAVALPRTFARPGNRPLPLQPIIWPIFPPGPRDEHTPAAVGSSHARHRHGRTADSLPEAEASGDFTTITAVSSTAIFARPPLFLFSLIFVLCRPRSPASQSFTHLASLSDGKGVWKLAIPPGVLSSASRPMQHCPFDASWWMPQKVRVSAGGGATVGSRDGSGAAETTVATEATEAIERQAKTW